MSGETARLALQVIDADCSSCVRAIDKYLKRRGGIRDVKSNPILNAVYIDYEPKAISEEEISKTIGKLGYKTVRLHGMK